MRAQANMATAGQIGTQIMGEKPDLILAIATPTAQAVAQAARHARDQRVVGVTHEPVCSQPITESGPGGLLVRWIRGEEQPLPGFDEEGVR